MRVLNTIFPTDSDTPPLRTRFTRPWGLSLGGVQQNFFFFTKSTMLYFTTVRISP